MLSEGSQGWIAREFEHPKVNANCSDFACVIGTQISKHPCGKSVSRNGSRTGPLLVITVYEVYFCRPLRLIRTDKSQLPAHTGQHHFQRAPHTQKFRHSHLFFNSQAQLDAIADQINNRPRTGSPMAVYAELLRNSQQHSTLIH